MDAIGEVKVLTSNYQAEYGRGAGGMIQVIIKGGTKDFHGLAVLHTGHLLIPVFGELSWEFLPGVNVVHMLDESLIKNTIAVGGLGKCDPRWI